MQDILSFVPLIQIEEYAHETAPLYKCSQCRWVFAPASSNAKPMVLDCPAGNACALRSNGGNGAK